MTDTINHPPHYTAHPSGVECIAITESLTFCMGNAIKYLWRADAKGHRVEDLKKALWYARRGHAVRKRFRAWELPDRENAQLVRRIRRVLAAEPSDSLLATALYMLVPELAPTYKGPPKARWRSGWPPLIRALEQATRKAKR